jgi:hypothetical protein
MQLARLSGRGSHPKLWSWIAPRRYDSPKDNSGRTTDYDHERNSDPKELNSTGSQTFYEKGRRRQYQRDHDSDGKSLEFETRLVSNFSRWGYVVVARRIFILLERHWILTGKSRANWAAVASRSTRVKTFC